MLIQKKFKEEHFLILFQVRENFSSAQIRWLTFNNWFTNLKVKIDHSQQRNKEGFSAPLMGPEMDLCSFKHQSKK